VDSALQVIAPIPWFDLSDFYFVAWVVKVVRAFKAVLPTVMGKFFVQFRTTCCLSMVAIDL
jgi:hypothetical protein